MADWGMVAAIVAVATIPIYASPLILRPLFDLIYRLAIRAYYRSAACQAIQWRDLHENPIRPFVALTRASTAGSEHTFIPPEQRQDNPRRSNIQDFAGFFNYVWQAKPRKIARPSYLDDTKEYLRVDADVIAVALLLDGRVFGSRGISPRTFGSSFALRYGAVAGQFRHFSKDCDYIVGRLSGFPLHASVPAGFSGITKDDLLSISQGYPPYYRQTLTTHSGVEINHPIQTSRDICRAGWVLAIGLSPNPPINMYNTRFDPSYREACQRVFQILKRLQVSYENEPAHSRVLDAAVDTVEHMNQHTSGSGAESLTRGTALLTSSNVVDNLNASQLIFALKFFNKYEVGDLDPAVRRTLTPILENVVRAAVQGVWNWWQYVNNNSSAFPAWLLDESIRQTPIWLENGEE